MLRFLSTGDWQLSNGGTIAGRFVLQGGINLTLLDRAIAVRRIIDYAQESDVDLVAIPGDLFDHANPGDIAIRMAVEAVQRLSQQAPVIIVKGNHDGAKASEVASALSPFETMRSLGVIVSERPETFSLLIKNQTINIFTLPYPKLGLVQSRPEVKSISPEERNVLVGCKMEDILSGFRALIDRNAINVLIGHFGVAGSSYSKGQQVPPFDVWIRKEFLDPFDVVMLGHLHDPQEFYSGTIARNGFDEEDLKIGFKVHEISEVQKKVSTEFIEIPSRKYLTISPEQFLKNSSNLDPEAAIRVKGKVSRLDYDRAIHKIKMLNLPFFKNSMEVETEAISGNGGDVSEEPSLEDALKLWSQGREGTEKFLGRLIQVGKEIEQQSLDQSS